MTKCLFYYATVQKLHVHILSKIFDFFSKQRYRPHDQKASLKASLF